MSYSVEVLERENKQLAKEYTRIYKSAERTDTDLEESNLHALNLLKARMRELDETLDLLREVKGNRIMGGIVEPH